LQKLQKHARSKCAVFAPLLRAGFRNFFATIFRLVYITFTLSPLHFFESAFNKPANILAFEIESKEKEIMPENNEKAPQESGSIFALTMLMMNVLLLTAVGGFFWLMQLFLSQSGELSLLIYQFRAQ
jgi:hypothetical protein